MKKSVVSIYIAAVIASQLWMDSSYAKKMALPSADLGFKEAPSKNLDSIRPAKSAALFKKQGGVKADYEKVLDQQIAELYKLTQKFKASPNRGEFWLRLAELYVEKATLIDSKKQDEYDDNLAAFQAGKLKKKPVLDQVEAREYNRKAVALYEWFERDFPNDDRQDQALFFLGYNSYELNEPNQGAEYYRKLTTKYPKSPFSAEAHFALGEYYFEAEKWADAYKEYSEILKDKKNRLHTFASYKGAWCLFRLGKNQQALNYLEYIIKAAREEAPTDATGRKAVNKEKLEIEASRDIVVFYAEGGDPDKAADYFRDLLGGDGTPMNDKLERLAYQYSERGNREAAKKIFKLLIVNNPTSPKAYKYQYQIVQSFFYAKNTVTFKEELYSWVRDYGTGTAWYEANKKDKVLLEDSQRLRELTLRNYVIQQHQTAQNSRAEYSRSTAYEGYQLYMNQFSDSQFSPDMHFYFAELLYDMEKYDEATTYYKWVVDNAPQSKYAQNAAQNLIVAVERSIPSDKDLQKKTDSLDPIPLDPKVDRFVKAGQWYISKFPASEKSVDIKYRIGRIYYLNNHFDEAIVSFRDIINNHPKSKYAEICANLILDIYNLKKDYAGLEKVGAELLTVPAIANSKTGTDIRGILEKSTFKKGQDLELEKKYAESAQAYEAFSVGNPKSALAGVALYNAGINYERASQSLLAVKAYEKALTYQDAQVEKLKPQIRRLLAQQQKDVGQFESAAGLFKQAAEENLKDPNAPNLMFNAAVTYEALGMNLQAIKAYETYIQINKKLSENLEAQFSLATAYRKNGQNSMALNNYVQYLEAGKDPDHLVEAAYYAYEFTDKAKSPTKANEYKSKVFSLQKKATAGGQGSALAGKIKLADAKSLLAQQKAIRFTADPAQQQKAATQKKAVKAQIEKAAGELFQLNSAEEIVSGSVLLAESAKDIGDAILTAPVLKGLNAKETEDFKKAVQEFAQPFMNDAKAAYQKAVEKGWELEVYNEDYEKAYAYMSQVDPVLYYDGGEMPMEQKLTDWMAPQTGALADAIKAGSDEKITQAANAALSADKNDFRAYNALALVNLKKGRLDLARFMISKAIAIDSKSSGLLSNKAMIAMAQGEQREAIKTWHKAVELSSSEIPATSNLGYQYVKHKDFAKAQVVLEGPATVGHKEPAFLNNYGIALIGGRKFSDAETVFKNLLKDKPGLKEPMLNLAIVQVDHLQNYKEAKDLVNRLKFMGVSGEFKNRINALDTKLKGALK